MLQGSVEISMRALAVLLTLGVGGVVLGIAWLWDLGGQVRRSWRGEDPFDREVDEVWDDAAVAGVHADVVRLLRRSARMARLERLDVPDVVLRTEVSAVQEALDEISDRVRRDESERQALDATVARRLHELCDVHGAVAS